MNELMNSKHNGRGTLTEFDRILQNMLNPFSDFVPEILTGTGGYPRIEVEQDEKELRAVIPLPGFKSKDISVEVIGKQLTVRAVHGESMPERKGHYIRKECSFAEFEESVRLPAAVKGAETSAKYTDGVLTVTLPRETPKTELHKVEVE